MRELMPYAAIVTPNLTELCALIDEAYHETSNEQELKRMCEKLSQMVQNIIPYVDEHQYLQNVECI